MTFQRKLLVGAALAGSLFAAHAQAATLVAGGRVEPVLLPGHGLDHPGLRYRRFQL